ncbi:unnamed protein product, partial [Rotaria sp. Silwood1]
MAVATILSELVLRDETHQQILWNKYKQEAGLYDVVIRIQSLEDLKTHGWEIVLRNYGHKSIKPEATPTITEGITVALLGGYNRGKTFLL